MSLNPPEGVSNVFSLFDRLAALRGDKKIFGSEGNRTWNLSLGQHKKVWNYSLELCSLSMVSTGISGYQ